MPEAAQRRTGAAAMLGILLVSAIVIAAPVLLWLATSAGNDAGAARRTVTPDDSHTATSAPLASGQFHVAPGDTSPSAHVPRDRAASVRVGTTMLELDLAITPEQRSFGLQGRSSLADDEGMVFAYDPPRRVTFARKTVPFPLDVLFIDPEGRIARIAPLDSTHEFAHSPRAVLWVVELPGGWCMLHDAEVGDPVQVVPR